MVELDEFVKLPEWADLLHVLKQERKAHFRQILAAHASACCQPQHQPSMVASLRAAGLDETVMIENQHVATITLKAVHAGQPNDALPPLTVTSNPQPTLFEAQEEACQVTLAYLLSIGPEQFRMVLAALAHGERSAVCLREAGRKVAMAAGPPAPGPGGSGCRGCPRLRLHRRHMEPGLARCRLTQTR